MTIMRTTIIAALLLIGCAHPGLVVGPSGLRSQEDYPLYSGQPCTHAAWLVATTERILPLVHEAVTRAGLPWRDLTGHRLCLVEQPARCGGVAQARGCSGRLGTWVARLWPPLPAAQSDAGLVSDLAHELVEAQAWGAGTHAHIAPWQGVDQAVHRRLGGLGLRPPE